MNSHSRVPSQTSKIRNEPVQKRIYTLEATLQRVLATRNELNQLNHLHQSLPEINQTEKSLKQLQKDIDSLTKQMHQIEVLTQKRHFGTQHVSVLHNIKTSHKHIAQLHQSVKQMDSDLPVLKKSRRSTQNGQSANRKNTLPPLLQRHRKQMVNIFKQLEHDCLGFQLAGSDKIIQTNIKNEITRRTRVWQREIKKINTVLGSVKCQAQFIKDRHKAVEAERRLNCLLTSFEGEEASTLLGIAEEEVELQCMQEVLARLMPEAMEQLRVVESQLGIVLQWMKTPVQQEQEEHLRRQVLYLQDRWFNIRNKIHAVKKRCLLTIRQVQDRLMSLSKAKTTQQGSLRGKLKDFQSSICSLNLRVESSIRELSSKETHIQKEHEKLPHMKAGR